MGGSVRSTRRNRKIVPQSTKKAFEQANIEKYGEEAFKRMKKKTKILNEAMVG